MRRASVIIACLGILGCTDAGEAPPVDPADVTRPHPAERRARLAVATTAGELTVIDVEFGEERGRWSLDSPLVELVPAYSGTVAAVVTEEAVQFLGAGVSIIDHTGPEWEGNEHIHIYKLAPNLLDYEAPAARRAVSYADRWAVAGEGLALAFDEAPLIQNDSPVATQVDDEGIAAGVVMPRPQGLVAQVGSELVWFDGDGAEEERVSGCTSPGGSWVGPAGAVVPCEEGWAVLSVDGAPAAQFVAYAGGAGGPRQALGHLDQTRVGGLTGEGFTWIDRDTRETATVELPEDSCEVAVESEHGEQLVVLGASGRLHLLDLRTGEAVRPATEVAAPFDCSAEPRPHLAVAPRLAFVSRPAREDVAEIAIASGVEQEAYPVGGAPTHLVVLGVDVRNRNAGTCSTCR